MVKRAELPQASRCDASSTEEFMGLTKGTLDDVQPILPEALVGKTMAELNQMVLKEQAKLNVLARAGQRIIRERLCVFLREMRRQFQAGESFTNAKGITFTGNKANGAYLRSIGIRPGTARTWNSRLSRKETAALGGETLSAPKHRRTPAGNINETESGLLINAAGRLARLLNVESLMPASELLSKAKAQSKEILDAMEGGRYEALQMETGSAAYSSGSRERTLTEWARHRLPDSQFKEHYFALASSHFRDKSQDAYSGDFEAVLSLVDDPEKLRAHAADFASLEEVVRSAGAGYLLLADAIRSAVRSATGKCVAATSLKKEALAADAQTEKVSVAG